MIDWFLNIQNLIFYVLDLIRLLSFFLTSLNRFEKFFCENYGTFSTVSDYLLKTSNNNSAQQLTDYWVHCSLRYRLTEARSEAFWHIQRWVIFQNSNCHWRNNRETKKKSWNKSRIKNDKWCCVRVPKSIGF